MQGHEVGAEIKKLKNYLKSFDLTTVKKISETCTKPKKKKDIYLRYFSVSERFGTKLSVKPGSQGVIFNIMHERMIIIIFGKNYYTR